MIDHIIKDWKLKKYKPIYWLEGEEPYYMDKLTDYAADHLLNEDAKAFNLTVLYGKDSDWATLVNACKRYPMQGDLQVVIVKEAQQLKDIEKIEPYVDNPLHSTVLIIAYKDKKVDGRTKFAKTLKTKGELITFKKIYENKLPEWTNALVVSKGNTIKSKALILLTQHVGSDLNRLENEIDKLIINLGERKEINEDDIEKYIGISKDYNAFELQNALANKNMAKAIQIIQYFESNPKAAPIQLVLPTLYSFFAKVFLVYGVPSKSEYDIANAIGVQAFMLKDYLTASQLYQYSGTEKAILLLQHYNLKSVGLHSSANITDAQLLKELVYKIIYNV